MMSVLGRQEVEAKCLEAGSGYSCSQVISGHEIITAMFMSQPQSLQHPRFLVSKLFPHSFLWNTVVCFPFHPVTRPQKLRHEPVACSHYNLALHSTASSGSFDSNTQLPTRGEFGCGLNSVYPPADSHPSQSPSLTRVCFRVKSSRLLQRVQVQVSVCP